MLLSDTGHKFTAYKCAAVLQLACSVTAYRFAAALQQACSNSATSVQRMGHQCLSVYRFVR